MQQGKKYLQLKMSVFSVFLFLSLILSSCKNEQPQTVIITPSPEPITMSTTDIDPSVATALAQITPTPTDKAQKVEDSVSATSEFVCEPPENWVAYTVQPNDTLIAIANVLEISIDEIKSANCKLDDFLAAGKILYLPTHPPIPQPPSAYQQPIQPANTNQREAESLTQEIVQELNFFGGGGVPSFLSDKCGTFDEPSQIIVTEQNRFLEYSPFNESFSLELIICDPQTTAFSTTLLLPTGEAIPLNLYLPPTYELVPPNRDATNDIYAIAAVYDLPLGHSYGTYMFVIEDYPEPGMKIERVVELNKGIPNFVRTRGELKQTITFYYFEPGEIFQLAAYDPEDDNGRKAEFISAQTYQVNEDGYLVIEIDPTKWPEDVEFTAYGEQSGFVSAGLGGNLYIANQGSVPLCQLSLKPTGTEEWKDYRIRLMTPGDFESLYVIQGSYDIEIRDCNDNVTLFKNNIDISQFTDFTLP